MAFRGGAGFEKMSSDGFLVKLSESFCRFSEVTRKCSDVSCSSLVMTFAFLSISSSKTSVRSAFSCSFKASISFFACPINLRASDKIPMVSLTARSTLPSVIVLLILEIVWFRLAEVDSRLSHDIVDSLAFHKVFYGLGGVFQLVGNTLQVYILDVLHNNARVGHKTADFRPA